jgi:hypothetical protein
MYGVYGYTLYVCLFSFNSNHEGRTLTMIG